MSVNMRWSEFTLSVWMWLPVNQNFNQEWNNGTVVSFNYQAIHVNMWWSDLLLLQCVDASAYQSTDFNQETIGTVEHLIHQAISVNMWWSNYFFFSMRMHPLPVNRIQSRNKWNCFKHQSSQAIPVSMWWSNDFSFSMHVDAICLWTEFNQETNGTVEHFNHQAISCQYVAVWFLLCSVCWSIHLWTEFNQETNGTVKHSILSSDSCQYVVVCFFVFQCVDPCRCKYI